MLNSRFYQIPEQATLDAVAVHDLRRAAALFAKRATTDNTRRAYKAGQAQYAAFCDTLNKPVHPGDPEIVALYLAWLAARYKPATISSRLSAVRNLYAAQPTNPTWHPQVVQTFEGIMRTLDARQEGAGALTVADINAMCAAWRAWASEKPLRPLRVVHAARNIAMLRVGFITALRRSEIARLKWNFTAFEKNGVALDLVHDKSQQRRYGRPIGIHRGTNPDTCPVAALERWRDLTLFLRGEANGCIFRAIHFSNQDGIHLGRPLAPKRVNDLVQAAAARAGLTTRNITAHSLRVGLITAMAHAGMTDRQTMDRSRHRSHAMVSRYNRPLDPLAQNLTKALGI